MTQRFQGRVALVTGGASGIGAATALRLASEGARVAVADIDTSGADEMAGNIEGFAVSMDVTDTSSVRDAVRTTERALGPIDVLVNCAGGGDRFEMFVETDEGTWDHEIAVNLRGTIACTHAVLPGMLSRGAGSIVNVASEAGRVAMVGGAVYSASKAGVIGFTKAIAREAARGNVRCNAVAPGPVDTPLLARTSEDAGGFGARVRQGMIEATLLGRVGRPEEVAGAVAFLASGDASYMTGQTLAVSGGLSMW